MPKSANLSYVGSNVDRSEALLISSDDGSESDDGSAGSAGD